MSAIYQQRAVDSANSEALVARTAMTYKPDGTKPAVLMAHGLGGSELDQVSGIGDMWRATDSMASAGYPTVSGYLAGDNWGSSTGTARMADCLAWARTYLGAKATGKYFVAGFSMGGITALNRAREDVSNIAGIILWDPDVGLVFSHDTLDGGIYAAGIEAAYGGSSAYTAAIPTRDPPTYGPTDLAGIPILCFQNTDLPEPIPTSVTDFLDDMSAVTSVTHYTQTGYGHVLTGFDLSPVKAWMDAHA